MFLLIVSLGRLARLKLLNLMVHLYIDKSSHQVTTSIQDLVDGICASVPFNLGDLTKPQPMYSGRVNYPCSYTCALPEGHQTTAMAYGIWYLFAPFKETMNVQSYLRKGQIEWLREQLLRLARISEVTPR